MKCGQTCASLLAIGMACLSQPAWADEADSADTIVVTALRDSNASITGASTSLQRYPQSVRVFDEKALERIGADRLNDVFDLAGGVARQNDFGGLWDKYSIRGFAGDENTGPDILINRFGSNLGFSAPIDTATVERFEFLKGAAAALSGRGEPGGSLNIVTKAPKNEAHGSASISYGSWNAFRATADVGGPLSGTVSVRLIGVAADKESFRDRVSSNRELIAPSIAFTPNDSLKFLYQAEYMRNRSTFDRGIVGIGGDALAMDIHTFVGEPGDGRIDQRIFWQQGSMFAALNDRVSLELGFSHRDGSLEGFSTMVDFGARGLQPGSRTAGRQRRFNRYQWNDLTLRAELTAKAQWLGMEHDLRIGFDRVRHERDILQLRARGSAASPLLVIDLFNPVYSATLPTPGPNQDEIVRFRSESAYAQDLVTLGDFTVLLGARWNSFRETLDRSLAPVMQFNTRDRGVTPRAAITWAATPQVSLYSSWGESLRLNPSDGVSTFDAERSNSTEVGVKVELFDGALRGQAALFTMTKRNVLNPNAADPNFKTQIGRQRSRGVEAELTYAHDGWFITGVYTYVDARVRQDNSAALVGTRLTNVPDHMAGLYVSREIGPVTIGGGITHVGDRQGNPFGNVYILPAYTTARANISWDISDAFTLRADVDNIFNRKYIANSYAEVWTMPGAPRNVRMTLTGQF